MARECTVCRGSKPMKAHLRHLHELEVGAYFKLKRGRYETYYGRVDNIGPCSVTTTFGEHERIVGDKAIRKAEKQTLMAPGTEVEPWVIGESVS